MAASNSPVLTEHGKLTDKSDKQGIEILVCDPGWFDPRKKYKISNAPDRTALFEFGGADLNFMARVLYAEASGTGQLSDKNARDNEKEAILNVKHFRLNRTDYPNHRIISKTFREVCEAPGQFESVFAGKPKFLHSDTPDYNKLIKAECTDLAEAIEAVKKFLKTGPNSAYLYDGFLGYSPNGAGIHIGRSRFFLSAVGAKLASKIP